MSRTILILDADNEPEAKGTIVATMDSTVQVEITQWERVPVMEGLIVTMSRRFLVPAPRWIEADYVVDRNWD